MQVGTKYLRVRWVLLGSMLLGTAYLLGTYWAVTGGLLVGTYLITRRYYQWRYEVVMAHRKVRVGGYIYFVGLGQGSGGLVKIGRSVNPIKRIRGLRTSAPYGLYVMGIFPVEDAAGSEALIHRMFEDDRVSPKNEWFRLTPYLRMYIEAVSDPGLTEQVRKEVAL